MKTLRIVFMIFALVALTLLVIGVPTSAISVSKFEKNHAIFKKKYPGVIPDFARHPITAKYLSDSANAKLIKKQKRIQRDKKKDCRPPCSSVQVVCKPESKMQKEYPGAAAAMSDRQCVMFLGQKPCDLLGLVPKVYNIGMLDNFLNGKAADQPDYACLVKHELLHGRQDACKTPGCEAEAAAYLTSESCTYEQYKKNCTNGGTANPQKACEDFQDSYCGYGALSLYNACQRSKDGKSCDKCEECNKVSDDYRAACLKKQNLGDFIAVDAAQIKKLQCVYCNQNVPAVIKGTEYGKKCAQCLKDTANGVANPQCDLDPDDDPPDDPPSQPIVTTSPVPSPTAASTPTPITSLSDGCGICNSFSADKKDACLRCSNDPSISPAFLAVCGCMLGNAGLYSNNVMRICFCQDFPHPLSGGDDSSIERIKSCAGGQLSSDFQQHAVDGQNAIAAYGDFSFWRGC